MPSIVIAVATDSSHTALRNARSGAARRACMLKRIKRMTMSRAPNVLLRARDDITVPVFSMVQCCAFGTCEFFHMAARQRSRSRQWRAASLRRAAVGLGGIGITFRSPFPQKAGTQSLSAPSLALERFSTDASRGKRGDGLC